MKTTHLLIKGSLTRTASCQALAPSILAESITSSEMLLRAPFITTIQPPAPVQKAITAKMGGKCPGADRLGQAGIVEQGEHEMPRADRGVEHEAPDQDARRAGERTGKIEQETEKGDRPFYPAVQQERQEQHQHH